MVLISYTYSTSSGYDPDPNIRMGVGPSFSVVLSQPFDGRAQTYTFNHARRASCRCRPSKTTSRSTKWISRLRRISAATSARSTSISNRAHLVQPLRAAMSQYAEQIGFAAGTLVGWRVDVLPNLAPVRFGIIQDVQLDFGADLKGCTAQNRYAIALGAGKRRSRLRPSLPGIRGRLFNDLYFGATSTTAQILLADNEAQQCASNSRSTRPAATRHPAARFRSPTPPASLLARKSPARTSTPARLSTPWSRTPASRLRSRFWAICSAARSSVSARQFCRPTPAGFIADMGVFYATTGQPLTRRNFQRRPRRRRIHRRREWPLFLRRHR